MLTTPSTKRSVRVAGLINALLPVKSAPTCTVVKVLFSRRLSFSVVVLPFSKLAVPVICRKDCPARITDIAPPKSVELVQR